MSPDADALDVVRRLFPFCCTVDGSGRLLAAGPSLARVDGELAERVPLSDRFEVQSPPCGATCLSDYDGELVIAVHRSTGLTFRGQVLAAVPGAPTGSVVLAWSPWITATEDFQRFGLSMSDFGAHDSTMDVLHLLHVAQTAHRDAVESLRLFERFFMLSEDAMLCLDGAGVIRRANDACRELLVGPLGSVIGRRLDEFDTGSGRDAVAAAFATLVASTGGGLQLDVDLRGPDGGTRHCRLALVADAEAHVEAMGPDANHAQTIYAVVRDITAEEEQHRTTQSILEAAPNATLVVDESGHVTYANEAADRLFGYRSGTLRGTNVDSLLPKELRAMHRSQRAVVHAQREVYSRRVMGRARHVVGLAADGELIDIQVTLTMVMLHGAPHMVASVVDVRSQKALERSLREARDSAVALSEARSQVLANTSHEIRTPLTSVLGVAELLLETPLSDEQKDLVGTLHTAGERLLSLVNDILDFAKAETGRMVLESVVFNIAELIDECVRLVEPQAAGKGLELEIVVNPSMPPLVTGDREKLRGVLINLLGNAVKFTESGGVRVLVAPMDGQEVEIRVIDTGIGIPESAHGTLFEPFVQADASTTRVFGGSGLGLAISDQFVRAMGGRIDVASAPGRGSVFTVIVPLPASDAPAPQAAEQPAGPLPAMSVLLVEDNKINATILKHTLTNLGMSVTTVGDGQQALDALRGEAFDVVFMDCHMPVLDGYAATRRIRSGEAGDPSVPVVALTASVLEEDRRRCLANGMDDFLSKPANRSDLEAVLARVAKGLVR